ncbi:4'-phosphopantetheinyl transferase superfamily protein [Streptomyces sp. NBC_01525]|uniref:4'-phosphopantetheinyl transferase family protein n=1 Tax=Streptomyces sp. NBC_01525 TaxID=2903893 RepID=UPI00386A92C9
MNRTPAVRVVGRDPLPGTAPRPGTPEVWLLPDAAGYLRARGPDTAHAVLAADERRRAAALRPARARTRYTAAHLLLHELLGAYLGRDPASMTFVRERCPHCGAPHGRPLVADAPLHFSLSRGGGPVLLAFGDVPVGVDAEAVPSASGAEEVARLLHPGERAELAALPAADRPAACARCWTRKEAYLKGVGVGFASGPAEVRIGAGPWPVRNGPWWVVDLPLAVWVDGPAAVAACAYRERAAGVVRWWRRRGRGG